MSDNIKKSEATLDSIEDSRSSVPKTPFKANIIVVGAEDHSLSPGNKLAFMMHAVRRYKLSRGLFKEIKVVFFKGKKEKKGNSYFEYTPKQINAFVSALEKLGLGREHVIEAKIWSDLVSVVNEYSSSKCTKVARMDFYGHGSNKGFWLSYEDNEFLNKENISSVQVNAFHETAKIYFYACQIGNGFINIKRRVAVSMSPYGGAATTYLTNEDKENYLYNNKKYSLAQAIASTWRVSVKAPMNRTNYFRTTMSKDKGNIKMTLIDNGLWHEDGAHWDITTIEEVIDKNMDGTNSAKEIVKFISPKGGELWRCNYQNFPSVAKIKVCQDLETGEKNIPCDGICFPAGLQLFLPERRRNRK